MPRTLNRDEDWPDDDDEESDWQPEEESEYVPDEDDSDDTIPCPHCGKPIYHGSEQCPRCGQYISAEEEESAGGKPWWIILGAILCLVAVYFWITA